MQISEVQVLPLRIPYPTPRNFGRHSLLHGDNVLVRLLTDEGHVGLGEAIARPYVYGESQVSIVHAIEEWFSAFLLARSPFDAEHITRDLDGVAGNPAAKAALEMALVELQAKAAGLPVWRYLGGYGRKVPLTWILTYAPAEQLAEEAVRRPSEGFGSFKVKVSEDERQDSERLDALRVALGNDVLIYVDANGTLPRFAAPQRMNALTQWNVAFIEDPIAPHDFEGRRWLRALCPLQMLADESAKDLAEVDLELSAGGSQLISLKLFRTGPLRARAILGRVDACGASVVMGGQGETTVGALMASHFAAAHQTTSALPTELSGALRFDFDLLEGGLPLVDGQVLLGDEPGYGVRLDWELLKRFEVPVWRSRSSSAQSRARDGWVSVAGVAGN